MTAKSTKGAKKKRGLLPVFRHFRAFRGQNSFTESARFLCPRLNQRFLRINATDWARVNGAGRRLGFGGTLAGAWGRTAVKSLEKNEGRLRRIVPDELIVLRRNIVPVKHRALERAVAEKVLRRGE